MVSTPSAAPVRERLPYGRLTLLAAVVFAAVTTELLPVGLLPQLAAGFGVGESDIGWWMSAYAIVVAVGAIPVTAFLSRFPRRSALVAVLFTYAASSAVIVLAGQFTPAPGTSSGVGVSFWIALLARVIGGLAHAGLFSLVVATAVSVTPPRRTAAAVAYVSGGVTLALAFGVPLGTALGGWWGWRVVFVGATVLMVLLAAVVARAVPEGRAAPGADPRPSVLGALRGRGLLLVGVTTVVFTLGHYTAYTYVTPLLLAAGVSDGSVSLVLFGYGTAGFGGLLLVGAFADRFGPVALRFTAALTGVVLLGLALVVAREATVGTVLVVLVWGLAIGAVPPLLQTSAMRSTTAPDAGPAVVNSTFNIGIAGGAWFGGHLLTAGSASLLPLAGGVLLVVALVLTTRIRW